MYDIITAKSLSGEDFIFSPVSIEKGISKDTNIIEFYEGDSLVILWVPHYLFIKVARVEDDKHSSQNTDTHLDKYK